MSAPAEAPRSAVALRRVALVFGGGTIESVGVDRLDLAWYIENKQRLTNEEVLARIPELGTIADVEEVAFKKVPSQALTDGDWLELLAALQELFDSDRADGIVVTHGTNTLEETAYFLHLALKSKRPVVVTGAMRPASGVSSDGDLNILNAVAVAASAEAEELGVLVVLNDGIYSARDVTKTSTFRVETFQGRDLGPLGYADADRRVVVYHRPVRRHTHATEFDLAGRTSLPRVDLVTSYVGSDGALIDAAVAAGAQGIVVAGTGAGKATPGEDEAVKRALAAGVAVCMSTRVGSGRVARSPGLERARIVAADNLVPWKARVLLSLGLTVTSDADDLQRMFETY
jgi:L-asparaginase